LKVAAIIQARSASTRFPNKVLHQIGGRPLIEIMMDRLRRSKLLDTFVVATTGSPQDDGIAEFCMRAGVACVRGSERDVLDRYYRAAVQIQSDVIVRLTADCPLIDPDVIDHVVQAYLDGNGRYDYVANNVPPPGTYPDGMDVEVFSMAALRRAWLEAGKPSEREHVTFYFWKNPGLFSLHQVQQTQNQGAVRLTVDYPEDLPVVEALLAHFKKAGVSGNLSDITDFLKTNPGFMKSEHVYGEGWAPSLKRDSQANIATAKKAPPLRLEKTDAAWKAAIAVVPGGAQTFSKSPAQYVKGVCPSMLIRGQGSKVWDLDGNEYIDYTLSLGPVILGHSHPEVNEAAANCAREYFNAPSMAHPLETTLAKKINSLIPGAEMVRFGKNGSDATAGAVRLARGFTNRDVIACCGYHGWQDWFIGSTSRSR
jgi:spore coat polysaccharide biosynthesis protein SpsF (cytidylyltransferase family)